MRDCFALLNEQRRPWIDPDSLKQKFLALSADVHPDRVHTAGPAEREAAQRRYTDLNAAYNRLREPKERLQHLLELELGARPHQVQRIPPDLMDLSMEVARLCAQADAFLAEKARTTSPLLRVELFERGQDWTEKLLALQKQINARHTALVEELKLLDADWTPAENPVPPPRAHALSRLEELYRLFSYVGRWSAQLQERITQLSF